LQRQYSVGLLDTGYSEHLFLPESAEMSRSVKYAVGFTPDPTLPCAMPAMSDRSRELYKNTFAKALDAVGGDLGDLAASLGVSTRDLGAWLRGKESPPFTVLVEALDLVKRSALPEYYTSKRRPPRIRR
jgi:hypothetical protein